MKRCDDGELFEVGDVVKTRSKIKKYKKRVLGVVKEVYYSEFSNCSYITVQWLEPEDCHRALGYLVDSGNIKLVNDPEVKAMLVLKYQGTDKWPLHSE